jgi:acyl carrier protein
VGVPGEVLIGGAGVARGYRNRPELTAEKFVVDPFSAAAGARMYRTGDLARWLADGTIEFLGRLDFQVKVRGFRIELGEIESVLSRHSAVKQAVVSVREDNPGDKRIVAYIVPSAGLTPAASELRLFLSRSIPDYMLPSAFVTLESLPLTPNGKVDRRALPWPDPSRTGSTDAPVAPLTPFEAVLVQIWAEVLGLERVGVDENFFALGGHSLLATQIISRVRDTFQVELPLRTLFQAPTVGELALILVQQMMEAASPESSDR